jgi:hypothetical protein
MGRRVQRQVKLTCRIKSTSALLGLSGVFSRGLADDLVLVVFELVEGSALEDEVEVAGRWEVLLRTTYFVLR